MAYATPKLNNSNNIQKTMNRKQTMARKGRRQDPDQKPMKHPKGGHWLYIARQ